MCLLPIYGILDRHPISLLWIMAATKKSSIKIVDVHHYCTTCI